jgi:hypothetical protein
MSRAKKKPKSSEHIHGRRKTWLSDGSKSDGRMDLSPRIGGRPWWKSPMMKEARMKKAATLRRSTQDESSRPLPAHEGEGGDKVLK